MGTYRAPAAPARRGPPAAGGARATAPRIIYYVVTRKGVLLLDVYAKSAKENLTDAEKQEVRKLVAAIEAQA
jgi:hypothetical protein